MDGKTKNYASETVRMDSGCLASLFLPGDLLLGNQSNGAGLISPDLLASWLRRYGLVSPWTFGPHFPFYLTCRHKSSSYPAKHDNLSLKICFLNKIILEISFILIQIQNSTSVGFAGILINFFPEVIVHIAWV